MKKYVFLTRGIEGYSGNPRYVNNKCYWLESQGWEVIVIWSYNVDKVCLEHIKKFDDNSFIFHELNFYPCWFTKKRINKTLEKIIQRIGTADEIVIESNKLQLGAWGELLAQKLGSKHIIFVTTEKLKIHNKRTFDFCYEKLQRNEFFTINKSAVEYLFSEFIKLDYPENYFWTAMTGVMIKEYGFPPFDELPQADYTITSFGRRKGYFSYMLLQLKQFISCYPNKKFNIFFLGELKNEAEIRTSLDFKNVNLSIYPKAVKIIPLQIFTKSDVIIATAGCANYASRNGGKVISMDVNNNEPLGYLRYTTLDSNTRSGLYENNLSLSEWLQTLLVDKKEFEELEDTREEHSFDFQKHYLTPPDGCYIDSSKAREDITRNDSCFIFLSKIGLFKIVDYLFFHFRKNNHRQQKTIIVEFNGLPGLGKTTVADILANKLNDMGYNTIKRDYRNSIFDVLCHKYPRLFSRELYKLLLVFARSIPPVNRKRDHLNFITSYAHKYRTILKYSKADFAIFDEAILQFMTSIAYKDRIPETDMIETIVNKLKSMGIIFVRIDCDNDVDKASKRLSLRPPRGLSYESMKYEELIDTLTTEKMNFEYLRGVFSNVYANQEVIKINMDDSPEFNSDKIISLLGV